MSRYLVLLLLSTFGVVSWALPEVHLDAGAVVLDNVHRKGAQLKMSLNSDVSFQHTDHDHEKQVFANKAASIKATLAKVNSSNPKATEYLLTYNLEHDDGDNRLCFHYGHQNASWHSSYEDKVQSWPLHTLATLKQQAFVSNDFFHGDIGSIVDYLFWSSNGFAIYLDSNAPIFISRQPHSGDPLLCFSLRLAKPFPVHSADRNYGKQLLVHISSAANIKEVHNFEAGKRFERPTGIPDERMITSPVWSTWARYHKNIDQNTVLNFAKEINQHGFPNAQLEIDDMWESHYGDFVFDKKKFPDAREMVKELKALGFRVTLWVYPFVNRNSDAYAGGQQYFLRNKENKVADVHWWDGAGAAVDFTMPAASVWFQHRLEKLKNDTGLTAFKFDAGETNWLGKEVKFFNSTIDKCPNWYTYHYVSTCAKLGGNIEVRSAFRSQRLPIFVRMMDRESNWGRVDGLRSLVPTALTMSMSGYSFMLPDMIGGNGMPTEELFVRWLQANTFLPSLQFSVVPWQFSEATVKIAKKFVELHTKYAPKIIELMRKQTTTSGEPLIRPMWWVEPEDSNTYTIDDQFMLGDDVLVAPVVEKGHTTKQVYLPRGEWIEQNDHKTYTGPGRVTVSAPIEVLPYFVRK